MGRSRGGWRLRVGEGLGVQGRLLPPGGDIRGV